MIDNKLFKKLIVQIRSAGVTLTLYDPGGL